MTLAGASPLQDEVQATCPRAPHWARGAGGCAEKMSVVVVTLQTAWGELSQASPPDKWKQKPPGSLSAVQEPPSSGESNPSSLSSLARAPAERPQPVHTPRSSGDTLPCKPTVTMSRNQTSAHPPTLTWTHKHERESSLSQQSLEHRKKNV